MVYLRYALQHALRRPAKALVMVLLPMSLLLFLSYLSGSLIMLADKREHLLDTVQVSAVVSDVPGGNSSQLYVEGAPLSALRAGGALSAFVGELSLARELYYQINPTDSVQARPLAGVSALRGSYANFLITMDLAADFAPGWDQSCLHGREAVVLVSRDMLAQGLALGQPISLSLALTPLEAPFTTLTMTVVGSFEHNIPGLMLCPFGAVEALLLAQQLPVYAQAVSFTLRDNRQLEMLRQASAAYFEPINHLAQSDASRFALTIQDDTLKASLADIARSQDSLVMLGPLLLGLSLLLGLLTGLLQVYGRRREMLLMRLQGTKSLSVLMVVLAESIALSAAGMLIGALVAVLLSPHLSRWLQLPSLEQMLWLFAAFVGGYGSASLLLTRGKLLRRIKEVL